MLKGRMRAGLRALVLAVVVVGSAGSYGALLLATGNIHTVVDSVLYRSAQLNKTQFETVIRQHSIKSILNLRGGQLTDPWYADEIDASKELGVTHFDYPISARRRVTPDQITDILSIVRSAPKPLLIHCRSGADRTGLVAALFLLDDEHADPAEADRQLSLLYGHFLYLLSKTVAMDESFWEFAGLSGAPNVAGR
jgi:protein tyrosine/serine phosphatase